MNKLKKIWNFLFGFKGRIGRLHFAIFLPFFLISIFIFNVLAYPFVRAFSSPSIVRNSSIYELILGAAILLILMALVTVFKYSHIARRTHDYGKSLGNSGIGTIIILLEIIGTLLVFSGKGEFVMLLLVLLSIIAPIFLIALVFIKGTEGPNQFGEEPIPFWKKRNIKVE